MVCFALVLIPGLGRTRLGQPGELPEFSYFSWISMMFSAGIGRGLMTYATAEPLYHFASNRDTIRGVSEMSSANNVVPSMKWAFFHWGLGAWVCYAIIGVCLAFFCYDRRLPLTIRSALTPLFGRALEVPLGHIVDISAVIATVIGVVVTVGFGVNQYASGI